MDNSMYLLHFHSMQENWEQNGPLKVISGYYPVGFGSSCRCRCLACNGLTMWAEDQWRGRIARILSALELNSTLSRRRQIWLALGWGSLHGLRYDKLWNLTVNGKVFPTLFASRCSGECRLCLKKYWGFLLTWLRRITPELIRFVGPGWNWGLSWRIWWPLQMCLTGNWVWLGMVSNKKIYMSIRVIEE